MPRVPAPVKEGFGGTLRTHAVEKSTQLAPTWTNPHAARPPRRTVVGSETAGIEGL